MRTPYQASTRLCDAPFGNHGLTKLNPTSYKICSTARQEVRTDKCAQAKIVHLCGGGAGRPSCAAWRSTRKTRLLLQDVVLAQLTLTGSCSAGVLREKASSFEVRLVSLVRGRSCAHRAFDDVLQRLARGCPAAHHAQARVSGDGTRLAASSMHTWSRLSRARQTSGRAPAKSNDGSASPFAA